VFVVLHGGPSSQSRPAYLSALHRHLVESLGMHLVLPNVRGSTGFGKRFTELDNGRRREGALKDLSTLLDHLAQRPEMDAGRVVVSGGSYGGYLSLAMAVAESPRIAGAISSVGISNFVSFLRNTESYRRDNRRQEYGDERDAAMRAFLEQISPLNQAARVRKPLFIVHGMRDPRVPYSEARQMAEAVRAQGTPVWLLAGEEEGHGFAKAENQAFQRRATVEFVRRVIEGRSLHVQAH
jgi:dipeptidyl aminopeptidase/acylaminoacyl peptidase